MYLHGNLGAGVDDYALSIDEGHISRLLTQSVINYFNDPKNFPNSELLEADGTYGYSSADGKGWHLYPHKEAGSSIGPKTAYGDITGQYGTYWRVPIQGEMQKWISHDNFVRLSQMEVDTRIKDLIKVEVPTYLKGKKLAEVAADLPTAIAAVVAAVKKAINTKGSWFAGWGLTVT